MDQKITNDPKLEPERSSDQGIGGDLLDSIFRALPNPIFFRDLDLKFRRCNDSFYKFVGADEEAVLGRSAAELCPEPMLGAIRDSDGDILAHSAPHASRTFASPFDGPDKTYLLTSDLVRDSKGTVRGFFGIISDISLLVESERKIERLMRLKDAILAINASILDLGDIDQLFNLILEKILVAVDHADVGCVLLLGEGGRLRIVASLGYTLGDTKDFSIRLEDTFQWKRSKSRMSDTLIVNDLQNYMTGHEMRDDLLKSEDGHVIRSSMSAPLVIDGEVYGLINLDSVRNNVFDETDRALMEYVRMQIPIAIGIFKSYERMLRDFERDKLTDAYNRRYFESIFLSAQDRALRYTERFSLVLFDINDLKKVNDSIGHLAGDMVLKHFAGEMKA